MDISCVFVWSDVTDQVQYSMHHAEYEIKLASSVEENSYEVLVMANEENGVAVAKKI